ncbi:MAG: signal recognition particle-docking protein FtsY [Candidatus Altiarchaeota archaeon]|nr:signal recognition particle-docking protein FtsY [Candidatus Altiarchaeota archaeon]
MFQSIRKRLNSFIGSTEEQAEKKLAEQQAEEKLTEEQPEQEPTEQAEKEPTEQQAEKKLKVSKVTRVRSALSSRLRLSEKDLDGILWQLQLDLIQSDVAVETAEKILEELKEKLTSQEVEKNKLDSFIKNSLRETLIDILAPEKEIKFLELIRNSPKPVKILFLGVNGTGKTTTMAKAAKYLMDNGFSIIFAAGDTFRAGAIEQLEKHAHNLGVKVIKHSKGADSAAVIYDAIEHATSKNIDVVMADTAGRMHTNINLMDEMKKVCRVNSPDLKIFVGDALTGNDAVEQAREFNKGVGIDAVILTKMDSDAKGGSALSIVHETKKPIILVGMGQSYGDLKEFDVNWFVDEIMS